MNSIKLRLEGNKVYAKSAKSECEIAFYPNSCALCAKGHEKLPNARLFVPTDSHWWMQESLQNGDWADVDVEMKIASNGKVL